MKNTLVFRVFPNYHVIRSGFPQEGHFNCNSVRNILILFALKQIDWSKVKCNCFSSLAELNGSEYFLRIAFIVLLWSAPELMELQRDCVAGRWTGTQKGDVYSFAIILHEILYRAGLFCCTEDAESIPAKSESAHVETETDIN